MSSFITLVNNARAVPIFITLVNDARAVPILFLFLFHFFVNQVCVLHFIVILFFKLPIMTILHHFKPNHNKDLFICLISSKLMLLNYCIDQNVYLKGLKMTIVIAESSPHFLLTK